jgi:drug/metabolite transporter (DMT)-like permease
MMNLVKNKAASGPHASSLSQVAIYGMLAFCLISWASSYLAIKVAVATFEPHHVAVLRFAVASLVLAFFLPRARPTMPSRSDFGKLFLYGASGIAIYSVLLCAAERGVGAGTASFIIGIAPIFTAVLASLVLKEKMSKRAWAGLAVAFAGAGMMSVGKSSGLFVSFEIMALLAAAMLSALSLTVQKSLLNRISPLACTIYSVWAGTLLLCPFLPDALKACAHAPMTAIVSVVYLGIVPAAIGYIFWSFVLAHTPAGRAAAFLYLVPAVAAVQSAVLLGELPTSWEVAGSAVIMLAVVGASPAFGSKLDSFARTVVDAMRQAMRTKPLCEDCE